MILVVDDTPSNIDRSTDIFSIYEFASFIRRTKTNESVPVLFNHK